jgi:hypothetical protein
MTVPAEPPMWTAAAAAMRALLISCFCEQNHVGNVPQRKARKGVNACGEKKGADKYRGFSRCLPDDFAILTKQGHGSRGSE